VVSICFTIYFWKDKKSYLSFLYPAREKKTAAIAPPLDMAPVSFVSPAGLGSEDRIETDLNVHAVQSSVVSPPPLRVVGTMFPHQTEEEQMSQLLQSMVYEPPTGDLLPELATLPPDAQFTPESDEHGDDWQPGKDSRNRKAGKRAGGKKGSREKDFKVQSDARRDAEYSALGRDLNLYYTELRTALAADAEVAFKERFNTVVLRHPQSFAIAMKNLGNRHGSKHSQENPNEFVTVNDVAEYYWDKRRQYVLRAEEETFEQQKKDFVEEYGRPGTSKYDAATSNIDWATASEIQERALALFGYADYVPESVIEKSAFINEKRFSAAGGKIFIKSGESYVPICNGYSFGQVFVVPLHACPDRDLFYFVGDKYVQLKKRPNSGFPDIGFYSKPHGVRSLSKVKPFGIQARRVVLCAYTPKADWEWAISSAYESVYNDGVGNLLNYTASSAPGHSGGLVVDSTLGDVVGIHLMGGEITNRFLPITEEFLAKVVSISKN
jgi:hypothetical protein